MKKLLISGLAIAASLGIGMGTAGADTVSVSVVPGSMSASTTDLHLSPLTFSYASQGIIGEVQISATDATTPESGWSVNLQADDFTGPATIDAANLEVYYVDAPVAVAGQAINAGGPKIPGFTALGSISTRTGGRNVMHALAGSGKGTYTENVGLQLTLPAQAPVGDYHTTLTVSITAAP
jgi:hypothetical protein